MNTYPESHSGIYKKFYSALLVFIVFLTACNKEPKMPPQTKTGEDVLACKVDGKVHIYIGAREHTYILME